MAKTDDRPDERKVEALRRLLNVEEPLPLGMRSRIEARMAAERRGKVKVGLAFPTVLGLVCFVGGSALHGLQVSSAALFTVLALGSVLYGIGLQRLVSDVEDHGSPMGGDMGPPLREE